MCLLGSWNDSIGVTVPQLRGQDNVITGYYFQSSVFIFLSSHSGTFWVARAQAFPAVPDKACSLPFPQPTVLCPVWRTLLPVDVLLILLQFKWMCSLFHYNADLFGTGYPDGQSNTFVYNWVTIHILPLSPCLEPRAETWDRTLSRTA